MLGKTISHYKILKKLGEGGMGEVYLAEDTKLDRPVALKFLHPHAIGDPTAKERLIREAKAASALEHPNICNIHEIDETAAGQMFIAMACYSGESLKDKIDRGSLSIDETLDITIQIAIGLEKAHSKEIIHRDIKPANILITEEGVVKIVDFGLAKLFGQTTITKEGTTLGTVAYMSPEQTRGTEIDHRSDIWSLGVVLYEMLCGERPFKGDYEEAVIYHILNAEPESIRKINPSVPEKLEHIINFALQKDPESRYSSVGNLLTDLEAYQASLKDSNLTGFNLRSMLQRLKKPKVALPVICAVLVVVLVSIWFFNRQAKIRWTREKTLPEIERMVEQNDVWRNLVAPYRLAEQAETILGDDPKLTELFKKCALNINIKTEPSGADVYMKKYSTPDSAWHYLGITPLDSIRVPIGIFRWKFEKEGYETVLAASSTWNGDLSDPNIVVPYDIERILDKEGSIPSGMVRVPETRTEIGELGDFFIDRYEVTNKEFKEFINKGGYRNKEYWVHKFIKDGKELTWEEAMRLFVDQSGQSGPFTWQASDYPEGQGDYPVSGISWYEAAAYAEFTGKSLPTLYHWGVARGESTPMVRYPQLGGFALLAPFSNFLGDGPVAVGSLSGLTAYGAFDMAGNVREWCYNESTKGRMIRGGAWGDNTYMFDNYSQAPAMNRSARNGFRCAVYPNQATIPDVAFLRENSDLDEPTKFTGIKPVDDNIYQVYKELYDYDKTDLRAQVEYRKDSPNWVLEKVSFDAAYSGERVFGYLFLPKNALRPYQTVIYMGGGAILYWRSIQDIEKYYEVSMFFSFLVKNGRAVLFPVFKGVLDRATNEEIHIQEQEISTHRYSELYLQQVKDIRRSIDYLESRTDIDSSKIAYYGMSAGSGVAAPILAVEERFKVSILMAGGLGFQGWLRPEINEKNFITRVKQPTLMLNGKYDSSHPIETSVRPMFDLLGTPAEHKRLKIYDTDHIPPLNETIRAILPWLDRYLGPVKQMNVKEE